MLAMKLYAFAIAASVVVLSPSLATAATCDDEITQAAAQCIQQRGLSNAAACRQQAEARGCTQGGSRRALGPGPETQQRGESIPAAQVPVLRPQQPAGPVMRAAPAGPRCEWSPRETRLPAATQCGFNDIALPNPGVYDCGLVARGDTCVQRCVFKRCQPI
jgi:hypothetical protein